MIRHGTSHGLAVLICTLASGFLIAMLKAYLPEILMAFSKASIFLCALLGLPYMPKQVELVLIASIMACVWGFAFSLMHKDKRR